MFSRNGAILAAAVVLGLIAVLIANAWFSGVEKKQEQEAKEQMLARIVVASQPMAFGTRLTLENTRMQNWPEGSVPTGAFRSLEAALKNNRVALRPIVIGEPVLADKVSGKDGRATLAATLPEGMRAVSIPITSVSGVSGFILPGSTVDVMLTRKMLGEGATNQDQTVDVVMQNVQVIAVDQTMDTKAGKPKPGKTATLQTDLYGAQKLILAETIGSLSLVLRNVESQEPAALTTVTPRDLGGNRFIGPGRAQARLSSRGARAFTPQSVQEPLSAMFRALAPQGAPQPVLPSGPVMSVYRGTEKADYAVGQMGGR